VARPSARPLAPLRHQQRPLALPWARLRLPLPPRGLRAQVLPTWVLTSSLEAAWVATASRRRARKRAQGAQQAGLSLERAICGMSNGVRKPTRALCERRATASEHNLHADWARASFPHEHARGKTKRTRR